MTTFHSSQKLLLACAGVIAIAAFLSPQLRAQEVIFTTSGFSGTATGANSLAGGAGSNASGANSTAIGNAAVASGANSTVTGQGSIASGLNSSVFGQFAFAKGANTTTVGFSAGTNAATNGVLSVGTFVNGLTAGLFSTAMGDGTGFGTAANSTGDYSVAIGGGDGTVFASATMNGAKSSGAFSTSVGSGSVASGASSSAYGVGAKATGTNATALGVIASATGTNSTAVGTFAQAVGANSVAMGADFFGGTPAIANGDRSVAIGFNAVTSVAGTNSVALGDGTRASAANTVAIGNGAAATGADAIALGNGSAASGLNATAIGNGAAANFANSTALGNGAAVTRANQMVFGTAGNTYTAPGITSAASLAAQTGTLSFVTTDPAGNLAAGPTVNSLFGSINVLSNRIHDVRQEERGGIGLAMATGQIRYDDTPGKISVGVGGGAFEDEGGFAGGIGFTSPNGRFRGNISAGGTTNGDFGGGAGLSITLN